jgi:hypothetical protein
MSLHRICAVAVLLTSTASPAAAQHFSFERTFDVTAPITLEAASDRGKITVITGATNRVLVRGTVTVRVAIDAPLNALAVAKRLAAAPPIEQQPDLVRLRAPADETERRAVTIAYIVTVPPETRVIVDTDSGAIAITGVRGSIAARTHSGAIALAKLGGDANIATGSGAVNVDGADANVSITTSSSAITARAVRAGLRVKTGSGAVSAESRGPGDIEVATASSAIIITGATGGVRVTTQSGSIDVAGRPSGPWALSTGSSAIRVTLDNGTSAVLDANTRSGSIHVTDLQLAGTQQKQRVQGTLGNGGPTVKMTSGSGSFDIRGR